MLIDNNRMKAGKKALPVGGGAVAQRQQHMKVAAMNLNNPVLL
jgi:hypothetical protein